MARVLEWQLTDEQKEAQLPFLPPSLQSAPSQIAALEAADVALDLRLDAAELDIIALEAVDVALDLRLDAVEIVAAAAIPKSLATGADQGLYATGVATWASATLTAFSRGLWAAVDAVALRLAIGLSNVDNTSDIDKPVSTAQATADGLRVLKAGDTMTGGLVISAGGLTDNTLTSGRVTYATAAGRLADSANHTWNNASGYLGVGNGVAAYPLDVYKTTGIVQSRTRTDDTTQYAQTLIQAGTSGIALAAFGTAWPAAGVYGPGTAAFQSAAANGIFLVNEAGEVHIVTYGFAAANKRFTFGSTANTSLEPLWLPGAGSNPTTTLGEGGAGNLLTNAYNDGTWRRIAITATPVGMFLNPNGAALADVAWYKSTAGAAGSAITWTRLMELVGATGELELDGSLVLPKTSGLGIKIDPAAPTFGWRTLTSAIDPKATGSGSPARTLYRGTIYGYAFGVGDLADFDGFPIPHDYLPGSDIFVNVHWSHNGTAISGTAAFEVTMAYAKGHNQANFPAEVTQTITVATPNIATVPQYRHRVDEVQASQAGGSATLHNTTDLEVDGLLLGYIKLTTLPTITGGSLFVHTVDVHYQSTNMATKQKSPSFYT